MEQANILLPVLPRYRVESVSRVLDAQRGDANRFRYKSGYHWIPKDLLNRPHLVFPPLISGPIKT